MNDEPQYEDYKLELYDPYWIKLRDALVEGHIWRDIATTAMLKCQQEQGIENAYA